jgi:hypothetical protein
MQTREIFQTAREEYAQYGWDDSLLEKCIKGQLRFQRDTSFVMQQDALLARFEDEWIQNRKSIGMDWKEVRYWVSGH